MRSSSGGPATADHRPSGEVVAPDGPGLARAVACLRRGGLVAFPTETVYGLGADATDDRAVARIFDAKGRPRFNPLIVHVNGVDDAAALAEWTEPAAALAERFWPGPLTLVLERRPDCPLSKLVSAGTSTVGLRMPAHPIAGRLLEAVERPLAGPSANPAGRVSPTTADHVRQGLGGAVDLIVDGGRCPVGVESTVLDLVAPVPRILRPGGVTREELESVLGAIEEGGAGTEPRSPGMLASHYAPSLPVRLDARAVGADEALLAFGPTVPPGALMTRNLSTGGNLVEAAGNLFSMLHELDQSGAQRIAAMPVPAHGLGRAIRDRLQRAAAPRPPRA